MKRIILAAVLALMTVTPGFAIAADHRVEMRNKGSDGSAMIFEPRLVRAEVGDTVTFVAIDKGHNSSAIKKGVPDGTAEWKGEINQEITVKIEAPGVYMFQCTPHFGMGMIGAIVAGQPVNLEAVKAIKFPGKAKQVASEIFAEIEADD
ncbi:pseudoazurin [Neorhizobium sp. Rsf11]|uniref:Pseudoazurin n=2 Tax=Neorhizobium TaxID=1525371 RepID=A0ABV0M2E4_9HYPH|nr:pseudoazurin [Neorhizobium petrolearium]MCC2612078.1 pseudoazurin [Neorhizobium petrolearium]WGI67235.1 pseudoazurin [Neorhizobium petrolearium]